MVLSKPAHTHTHIHTSGACCMDHTAQRVLSLVPCFLSETVRDFYSVSVFYRSGFYCYSLQNIRGCKLQIWKRRKLYTVMLY